MRGALAAAFAALALVGCDPCAQAPRPSGCFPALDPGFWGPNLNGARRVAAIIGALKETVRLGETLEWAVQQGSADCPVHTGDAPFEGPAGSAALSGACSMEETIWAGDLELTWARQGERFEVDLGSANWRYEAPVGEPLQRLELGGDARVVRDPAGSTVSFDGRVLLLGEREGDAGFAASMTTAFPDGFEGQLEFVGVEDTEPATYELEASLDTSEGPLWVEWSIEWGDCPREPSGGTLRMNTRDEFIELGLGGRCDGCVAWTYGSEDNGALCFGG